MRDQRQPLGRASQETLHRQVASRLGARIVGGELPEGYALPNEAVLGAELGVSRTVVREAVKVLAAKHLLEVRPKTGTRVRQRRDWNTLDPEVLEWQFSGPGAAANLEHLLEVRLMVEPTGARMAADRALPEDLDEIGQACSEMEAVRGDSESSIESDLRFHLAVLSASHNVFMKPFGAMIQAALRSSFRLTNKDQSAYLRSVRQHRNVFEAIRAANSEDAESAMRELLMDTSDDIRKALRSSAGKRHGRRGPKRSASAKRKGRVLSGRA